MFNINVRFKSMEDVENFHRTVVDLACDVDAIKGSYIVDAKSFMGLLTMDMSSEITLLFHTNDLMLINKFEEWKV